MNYDRDSNIFLSLSLAFPSQYNRLINDMLAVYNGATICAYNDPFRCGLRLYPGNNHISYSARRVTFGSMEGFASSRSAAEKFRERFT